MENQGATIPEVSRILGISENAVLQRIKRGTLRGKKDMEGKWRVFPLVTDQRPTDDQPTNQQSNRARTIDVGPLPLQSQQESAALVIREAIAPFIERLEIVNQQLGQMREQNAFLRLRVLELEGASSYSTISPDASEPSKQVVEQESSLSESRSSYRGTEPDFAPFWNRVRRFLGAK